MFLAAGAGQFGQLLRSAEDVREAALFKWAGNNSERLAQVGIYQKRCVKALYRTEERSVLPITLSDCIKANHLEDVASVAQHADDTLKTAAWPLSLLDPFEKTKNQNDTSAFTVIIAGCREGVPLRADTVIGDFKRSYPLYKDGQNVVCQDNRPHLNGVALTNDEVERLVISVITAENAADAELVKLEDGLQDQ